MDKDPRPVGSGKLDDGLQPVRKRLEAVSVIDPAAPITVKDVYGHTHVLGQIGEIVPWPAPSSEFMIRLCDSKHDYQAASVVNSTKRNLHMFRCKFGLTEVDSNGRNFPNAGLKVKLQKSNGWTIVHFNTHLEPVSEAGDERYIELLRDADIFHNVETQDRTEGSSSPSEADRLSLLAKSAIARDDIDDPIHELEERVLERTVELLGGEETFGRPVRNDDDLMFALLAGFPGQVLRKLQEAGYQHSVLERVIAPRRTLMRRRAPDQRLTSVESDAAWRLGHILVMASEILNGSRAAIAWLTRPKEMFANKAPVDLMETSVGSAHVERLLKRLDWGDIA